VKWRRAREGFPQELLDEEMRKIGISIRRLEETLGKQDYLVAGQYSLADICNFAIANGMQHGFPEFVNEKDTPGLMAWIARINERPACKEMFAKSQREKLVPAANG
jgi:glutathione S-transferase